MKYLKSCLPKGNSLDTTILSISISLIEIGLLYWWNMYSSVSVLSSFIIFYPVLYMVLIFFINFVTYIFFSFFHLNQLSKVNLSIQN